MTNTLTTMIEIMRGDAEMFDLYYSSDKKLILPALLAGEDHRGSFHRGIDYWSILRVMARMPLGGGWRGLSTIEQQYVRLIERRRGSLLLCKVREMYWAWHLGGRLTKEQIWSGYLWRGYFGAYMIGYGAARRFFVAPNAPLTPEAAASIVACLKYPRPRIVNATWESRHSRRVRYVLRRWSEFAGEFGEVLRISSSAR